MNNPLDFSGKVALVTGAATGMGLATARAFAEAGAAVALVDVNEGAVEAEGAKLIAAGHKALAIRCERLPLLPEQPTASTASQR
jgi:NAD(P)-dependent dehydrogenase (short-subunit alcohol dehydrogenase family)